MMTVEQALALIPGRRDILDNTDDALSDEIRHVQDVLTTLKLGVPFSVSYETPDGAYVLEFRKHNGEWAIMYGTEGDDEGRHDTPLVKANRQARSEVFTVPPDGHLSPLEQLFPAAAEALEEIGQERSPQLAVAMRLRAALERAGFPAALK